MMTHGSSHYNIEYLESVVRKDIKTLSVSLKKQIKKAIDEKLTLDPIGFGKPLRYSLKGHRRLRVGDYRVVYRIEKKTVLIIGIKHRKNIYDCM